MTHMENNDLIKCDLCATLCPDEDISQSYGFTAISRACVQEHKREVASTRCHCGSANTYLSGEGYERELVCRECHCVDPHPELAKKNQNGA